MTFIPSRRLGFFLGLFWLLSIAVAIVYSILRLSQASFSIQLLVWVLIPLLCIPLGLLVIYRMYGLFSARYHLDRDGFSLTWGLAYEQIPMSEIQQLRIGEVLGEPLRPSPGLWWPGCVVGEREVEGLGKVEFFSTRSAAQTALLSAGKRHLAISPPDLEVFRQTFVDVTRLGSLEQIPEQSIRPNFTFARIWKDPTARWMLVLGLILPIGLMAFLTLQANRFPSGVVFGFTPQGSIGDLVPVGRLLILPLIGMVCWVVDTLLGFGFFHQDRDKPIAYVLWGVSILTSGLLWGAGFMLLDATQRAILG
jgi:hypothetical protein